MLDGRHWPHLPQQCHCHLECSCMLHAVGGCIVVSVLPIVRPCANAVAGACMPQCAFSQIRQPPAPCHLMSRATLLEDWDIGSAALQRA